jgi:NAD(P)-dependent dehydrogenase (short-subunit alcohol dehydrogenase family)
MVGRSIALALGHAGAIVCVNCVAGEDKPKAMVDELRGHGHTAFAFKADVSSEDEVAKMFEAVRDKFGTVDILVNNAGLQSDAPFDQMTLARWNKVIVVNLTGQFLRAREAVREFKRRGIRPEISCCADKISQDPGEGAAMFEQLRNNKQARVNAPGYNSAAEAYARLSIGAKICRPPATDREFGTIDFLTLLDLRTLPAIVRLHFCHERSHCGRHRIYSRSR